jgi:CDP-diacylglycerol---serine O-phosphatidyltransferase
MKTGWIPNTFTLGNLTCGFIALIYASSGSKEGTLVAAVLILIAAMLDGFDGEVARRLGVASPIGKELDSLSDCVAFGVAPGFLAYQVYLNRLNVTIFDFVIDLGILMAAVFPICAAYRLARFNVQSVPGSFSGLPSPVAGILVALLPLSFQAAGIPRWIFAVIFLVTGFLMVSTVTYAKPQATLLKQVKGLKLVGLLVVSVFFFYRFGFKFLFLFITVYVLSGLVGYVIKAIEEYRY